MNYLLPLLLAGALAGGAGFLNIDAETGVQQASLHAPQAKSGEITYAARAPGVDAVCLIKRAAGSNPYASSLTLEPDCVQVFFDLGKAVSWLDRDDGTAAIVDAAGRELLVLGPSDGFAYETNTLGSPIVTLTALGNV
jgi:hypothetical protein